MDLACFRGRYACPALTEPVHPQRVPQKGFMNPQVITTMTAVRSATAVEARHCWVSGKFASGKTPVGSVDPKLRKKANYVRNTRTAVVTPRHIGRKVKFL